MTAAPTTATPVKKAPRQKQLTLARLTGRLAHNSKLATTERRQGYVSLVRLGNDSCESADDFRLRLLQANMKPSRASEIGVILQKPEVARKFIAATDAISWREALRQARGVEPVEHVSPPDDPELLEKALREQVEALCFKLLSCAYWQTSGSLDCGCFNLGVTLAGKGETARAFVLHRRKLGEAEPASPPDEWVRITLSPPQAERLSRVARFSGLNRAEVVSHLLAGHDLEALEQALASAAPGQLDQHENHE